MGETWRSILTGTAGITAAVAVALALALVRGPAVAPPAERKAAARVAWIAVLAQTVHFVEEVATGFPSRFPAMLGLRPWPMAFFIGFNLFWLGAWTLSCAALPSGRRAALAALWFLALASLLNGLAHPLLALRAATYFPGLLTAPLLALTGWRLLNRLLLLTRPPAMAADRS
jgi:Protein of unknown function with HXXEE motif